MKKICLPFLSLLLFLSAAGQKSLPPAGQVTYEELKMKSCSFDPDAPAMKLFEEEEVSFELYTNGDMQLKTEHRTRIKIFNENGYEHANINIPYLTKKSLGKIKELTAYVYTLEQNDRIVVQKLNTTSSETAREFILLFPCSDYTEGPALFICRPLHHLILCLRRQQRPSASC